MPPGSETTLFRAVGMNEAGDIESTGGFRLNPTTGYEGGKWFAAAFTDAVHWGRALQRFPLPRPFRVATLRVPSSALDAIEFHERWDAIGPAYYVREDQLPALNRVGTISVFDAVYDVEDAP